MVDTLALAQVMNSDDEKPHRGGKKRWLVKGGEVIGDILTIL